MGYFKLVGCWIKFQICIGYFPDGRMRTRTFGISGVRPDVSADDVAAVAKAIAPLLAHPIVNVRVVRKYELAKDASNHPHYRSQDATLANANQPDLRVDFPRLSRFIVCLIFMIAKLISIVVSSPATSKSLSRMSAKISPLFCMSDFCWSSS